MSKFAENWICKCGYIITRPDRCFECGEKRGEVRKYKRVNRKPVIQLNMDRGVVNIYESVTEASMMLGTSTTTIRNYINSGQLHKDNYYLIREISE